MTKAQKQKRLDLIAKEIEKCALCKKGFIGKAVPGEGNPEAKVLFVGEAPGKTEAGIGRPFLGRSGKFLRENIRAIGLKEKDFYIASPVKRLPKRGTPDLKQIAHGQSHLRKQIEIIKPKIIVLLGRVAALAVLGEDLRIMREHGKVITGADGIRYLITTHPAPASRFPKNRKLFLKDFGKLALLLKKS